VHFRYKRGVNEYPLAQLDEMTMTMNASILDGHLLFEGQVVYDEQVSSDMLDLHTYLITDSCAHNQALIQWITRGLRLPYH
jgi:hypothetical protein